MSEYDLGRLDSATRYPSIETYHPLDSCNGRLLEFTDGTSFDSECAERDRVTITEKIDGANGRIVLLPGGDWLIGSRKELLTARGDRVANPTLGIVDALRDAAERLASTRITWTEETYAAAAIVFVEVFGGRVNGRSARNYAGDPDNVGWRCFDVALSPLGVLDMEREEIARWRDAGGQRFVHNDELVRLSEHLPLVPSLGELPVGALPTGLAETHAYLVNLLRDGTRVPLDDTARGRAEGVVLRTADRSVIRKARIEDYE